MTATIDAAALVQRYDGLLLDAYGVLVDGTAALPGAAAFLGRLRAADRPFVVLSNDASRLPETAAARFASFGLDVDADRIVTSGSLIAPYFAEAGLQGRACIVLGPTDSTTLVQRAGGRVVAPDDDDASVIVVCDDAGYPFLATIEAALSTALRRLEAGGDLHLVLPNPDLVYPKRPGEVGLTSGSIALCVEAGLRVRFGAAAPRFVPLGKPHPPIFHAGVARLGLPDAARVAMVGDQLLTDIAGARAYGLDAILVTTGLARADTPADIAPTFVIEAL